MTPLRRRWLAVHAALSIAYGSIFARVALVTGLAWGKDASTDAVGPPGAPEYTVSLITNRFDIDGPVIDRHWR